MSELEVKRLMADYNYWNDREVKAEIFFREHVDELEEKHIKTYIVTGKQIGRAHV